MKKILSALLVSASLGASLTAQSLDWTTQAGGLGYQETTDIAVDADGNVISVGHFQASIDLDPGPGTAIFSSAGFTDLFIQKLDANGNYVWGGKIGGGSSSEAAYGVATDGDGNVYVTGTFDETTDFDISPSSSSTMAGLAGTSADIFVLKLTAAGGYVWSVPAAGTGADLGKEIAVDEFGNVYVAGVFRNTCEFADMSGGSVSYTAWAGDDVFVWKLNSAGTTGWVHVFASTAADAVSDITLDVFRILVTGSFGNTFDEDGWDGPIGSSEMSKGGKDTFLAELNSSGDVVRKAFFGSAGDDVPGGMDVNSAGDVLLAGYFKGTLDFDPGADSTKLTPGAGIADGYVVSLDNTFGFNWAVNTGSTGGDGFTDLSVDGADNIWVAGTFEDTLDADFSPGGTAVFAATSVSDGIVINMDASGNYVWAGHLASTLLMTIYDLQTGPGTVAISGYFTDSLEVDPSAGISWMVSEEFTDGFTLKLDICTATTPGIYFTAPTLSTDPGFTSWQWMLDGTPIVGAISPTYVPTTTGDYSVQVTDLIGCTFISDTINVIITARADAATSQALTLYPNPTAGLFTLSSTVPAGEYTVRILDLRGSLLRTAAVTAQAGNLNLTLDLSAEPAGMYIVEMDHGGERSHGRIVKQ